MKFIITYLPSVLMQTTQGERLHFKSIKELFEAMPHGLNKKLAKGIDTIVQFHLTGQEPTDWYLTIKDLECTYTEGIHPNPKTMIQSESKLWLAISNNEVSGDQAFINREYTAEGDMTILLKLSDLFAPPSEAEEEPKAEPREIKFAYKTFEPGRIKKIVVFDGGPRNTKYSKTTFMVKHFCRGAKSAGAEIEYVKLKDMKINRQFMEAVSDVEITQKKFQEQADYFWESLDGKTSYLKSSSKLEYTN